MIVHLLHRRRTWGVRGAMPPPPPTFLALNGAAGAIEAVASVATILNGEIHPTINYNRPDPECDLDYVPNTARKQGVDTVLSNSFGFGGQNAVLVLRRFDE